MKRQFGFSAIALTVALISLSGCREEGKRMRENHRLAPVVSNPHVGTEQKFNLLAEKVDAITTRNVHNTLGGKNPARFDHTGFIVMADFLYWRSSLDNLEFGYDVEIGSTKDMNERMAMDFSWDAGFRLGLGYQFGQHDQWDARFVWTWLHNTASGSYHTSDFFKEVLFPTWYSPLMGHAATKAFAHWRLHYNTLDFELGRDYMISKNIALRPYLGVRGAWIDQEYEVHYRGVGSGIDVASELEVDNDYHAAGVRLGTDMILSFNQNWGFIGKLSGSLLYGRFSLEQDMEADYSSGPDLEIKSKERFLRVRPNMETGFGLMYETDLNKHKNHLSLAVLYELSYWFNQNEMYKTTIQATDATSIGSTLPINNYPVGGDLGMQGVTFKFQYHF